MNCMHGEPRWVMNKAHYNAVNCLRFAFPETTRGVRNYRHVTVGVGAQALGWDGCLVFWLGVVFGDSRSPTIDIRGWG